MPADALHSKEQPSSAEAIPGHSVIASMQEHGIGFSADNYAVWQGYLDGNNRVLKRAIDILLSNGLSVDARSLRALYTRHFCHRQDVEALRNIAQRTLQTVGELRQGPPTAGLQDYLDRLGGDLAYLATLGEQLARKLGESEARIAQLEFCLNDARQEACTDPLTGVANRRAMDAALRTVAGNAMNDGGDVGFVLIDIDNFKRVNDSWGHPVGDEVLRMIAGTLAASVRGSDKVARYGGEEFAVILPGAGPRAALKIADMLRALVADQRLSLAPALPLPGCAGQGRGALPGSIAVTISAGVSCYDPGEPFSRWLSRADRALYAAKEAGRNQVVLGALEPPAGGRASNVVPISGRFS